MNNDPIYHRLREATWRGKLDAAEAGQLRAWLAAHPEHQADWEAEAQLSEALARLPEAPVASNFTARVLQEVERQAGADGRRHERKRRAWLLRWWLKGAFAAIFVGTGFVAYQHAQAVRLTRLTQSVAAVSEVSSLPSPKILEDFDAIRALPATPAADEQLLTLLK